MAAKGRINHIIKALRESGFYPQDEPTKPGEITPAVESTIRTFLAHKNKKNEKGRIKRVINAFRTIEPGLFSGISRTCDVITDNVRTAVAAFLAKAQVPNSKKIREVEIA